MPSPFHYAVSIFLITTIIGTFLLTGPGTLLADTDDTDNERCFFMSGFLGENFENSELEVLKLQLFLNAVIDADLDYTMRYDGQTKKAVKTFQRRYRDEILQPWVDEGYMDSPQATGLTYITTRTKIDNMLCPDKEPGALKPAETQ